MSERNKRAAMIAAVVVMLLSVLVIVTRKPAEVKPATAPPPVETGAATSAPSAVASDDAGPAEEPSANAAEEPPADSASASPGERGRGAAGPREASGPKAKPQSAPSAEPTAAAVVVDAGAPATSASAVAAVKEPPPNPALVGQFVNRAGKQFKLVKVTALLDGQPVYSGVSSSAELFRRNPSAGSHTLSIAAEYQGNGGGVFSYFDGYKFTVRANQSFSTKADAPTQITAAVVERGGQLTDFKDRLAVMINVR